jgi:hypothetical protein
LVGILWVTTEYASDLADAFYAIESFASQTDKIILLEPPILSVLLNSLTKSFIKWAVANGLNTDFENSAAQMQTIITQAQSVICSLSRLLPLLGDLECKERVASGVNLLNLVRSCRSRTELDAILSLLSRLYSHRTLFPTDAGEVKTFDNQNLLKCGPRLIRFRHVGVFESTNRTNASITIVDDDDLTEIHAIPAP